MPVSNDVVERDMEMTPFSNQSDDFQALLRTTEAMREAIRQTNDAIQRIDDIRDAIVMVRRSSGVEKLVGEALKAYTVMNEEQFELRQQAAEAHLRTQRRAGELLSELTKHTGGRPRQSSSNVEQVSKPSTLTELRIDRHDSHRWQRLASIPLEMFDQFIRDSHERRRELTTTAMLAVSKRHRDDQQRFGDSSARPSSKPALLLEYDRVKREFRNVIWLDPYAIAEAMDECRCLQEFEDLQRLRLWLNEFEAAMSAQAAGSMPHLWVAGS